MINGNTHGGEPGERGTKIAAHYQFMMPPGEGVIVRCRLAAHLRTGPADPFVGLRRHVRDASPKPTSSSRIMSHDIPDADARHVQRQAVAGLIWTKQFYKYDVYRWLKGDPAQPPRRTNAGHGRNDDWQHLKAADVLSMPDKWEYPWFCGVGHGVSRGRVRAIRSGVREGTTAAAAARVVHAPERPAARLRVELRRRQPAGSRVGRLACLPDRPQAPPLLHAGKASRTRARDWDFLERVFHKLMINFTWWVNRKDAQGRNVFQGGFLGLDNIGVFDRSHPLPTGGFINQADGTAWMAMYSLNLMRIALELATQRSRCTRISRSSSSSTSSASPRP